MVKWPHCPNGCGPLTKRHGIWGCPDCNYIWNRSEENVPKKNCLKSMRNR